MKKTVSTVLAILIVLVSLSMPSWAGTWENPTPLTLNTPVTATIADGECDYFSFTPDETGFYNFASLVDYDDEDYEDSYADPIVTLYQDGEWLAWNDDGGNYLNFSLGYMLLEGVTYTYEVFVYDYYEGTSFDVVLTKLKSQSHELELDSTKTLTLDKGEIAYCSFTPAESGKYNISSSGSLDTYVTLFRGNTQLAYNDDGGYRYNFSLTYRLVAGTTYTYRIRLYSNNASGTFDVNLTMIQPDTPGTYNPGDIAVINKIIDDNGLWWEKAPADGSSVPDEWSGYDYYDDDDDDDDYYDYSYGYYDDDDDDDDDYYDDDDDDDDDDYYNYGISWSGSDTDKRVTGIRITWEGLYGDLDLTGLAMLAYLDCSYNQLTSLDVSDSPELIWLRCGNNKLTELDLSNNSELWSLYCYNNKLTSLDVSNSSNLDYLQCSNNKLTELDVSNIPWLWQLDCSDNQLTVLNLSNSSGLYRLNCSNNKLAVLDVTGNRSLGSLDCSVNSLSVLDVSGNRSLYNLDCSFNQLTTLNLSNNRQLYYLNCSENLLTELNLRNNRNLEDLICSYNQLTSLDVSRCYWLYYLDCRRNYMVDRSDVIGIDDVYYKAYFNPQYPAATTTATDQTTTTVTTDVTTTTVTTDVTTTTITTDVTTTTTTTDTTTTDTTTTDSNPADTVIMRIDELYAAVDGEKVKVNDAQDLAPIFNQAGKTMVPFRFIATCFGCEVDWDGDTGSVVIIKGDDELKLPIDMPYAYLNGEQVELAAPAQIMTFGRTFVPFRSVSQLLGIDNIEYDFGTETIIASAGEIDVAKCVADYNRIVLGE